MKQRTGTPLAMVLLFLGVNILVKLLAVLFAHCPQDIPEISLRNAS
jgi:hypothetical protein